MSQIEPSEEWSGIWKKSMKDDDVLVVLKILPFPPEIFLHTRAHGRHKVVEIHNDVDPHVKEPTEGCVTSTNKSKHKSFTTNLDAANLVRI